MPLASRSSLPRSSDEVNHLQSLRERAMARLAAEEDAERAGLPAVSTRRDVLRGLGVLMAGVVPVGAALLRTQAALAATPAEGSLRSCAPQYGAPWYPPPDVPYEAPAAAKVEKSASELAHAEAWTDGNVVVLFPGHGMFAYGDSIVAAKIAYYERPGEKAARSLVVVADAERKITYLLHGGSSMYAATGSGLVGYAIHDGVLVGSRALASTEEAGTNLEAAAIALARTVDTKAVRVREQDLPGIDLRMTTQDGFWESVTLLRGASLQGHKLSFWVYGKARGGGASFTIDVEKNKLLEAEVDGKKVSF